MRMRKLALGVTASVLLGTAPCAPMADARTVSGNDAHINAASVDASRPVTLTVRKLPVNPNDDVPAGQLPPAGVQGLTFSLSRIERIDITTDAGRTAAKLMTVEAARAQGATKVTAKQTDAKGEAHFTGLTPALYLLEESAPNDPTLDYRLSAPQLVILPLANAEGSSFTYDSVVVTKPKSDTPTPPPTPAPSINPLIPVAVVGALAALPALIGALGNLPGLISKFSPSGDGSSTPGASAPGTSRPEGAAPGPAGDNTQPDQLGENNPADQAETGAMDSPGTPGDHGTPDATDAPSGGSFAEGGLASTGANVIWALIAGSMLVLIGAVLARRRTGGRNNV